MAPRFNLIRQPWLPVESEAGQIRLYSVAEVFENAPELGRIRAENPLLTATLYRFLLALLYRTQPPKRYSEWARVWRQGTHWNLDLRRYLDELEPRFDLFHLEHPFLQSTKARFELAPIQKLIHEAASGNNPVFYTHTSDRDPHPLTFDEAARRLIAMQSMGLAGLAGPKRGNFTDGLLIGETLCVLEGENLFRTLHLNLLVDPGIGAKGNDLPSWEKDLDADEAKPLGGILDYLTRPTRKIHLEPTGDGLIIRVEMLPSPGFAEDVLQVNDPMLAYDRRDEKKGVRPVRLRSDRSAWRYADVLLSTSESRGITPCRALAQLKDLINDEYLGSNGKATLRLLGSERRPGKAVLVQWRDETIPFLFSVINSEGKLRLLSEAVLQADDASRSLAGATRALATEYLKTKSGSSDPNAIGSIFAECDQGLKFWSDLDKHGARLVFDPEKESVLWTSRVADALRAAFERAYKSLPDRGAYEAYSKSAGIVYRKYYRLRPSQVPQEEALAAIP